jgi:DNA-binding beta-propeller fold protein YncE
MFSICSTASLILAVPISSTNAQDKAPLRLLQTIPMPNVKGRIDHMHVDVKGKRMFVAALENGSLEVVDLAGGKRLRSIPGFQKPQGVWFIPELKKVFVASGDDGKVRVFRGDSLDLLDTLELNEGPNRVNYDSRTKLFYVGYWGKGAEKDFGQIGIIGARTDKLIANLKVAAHPSEILLDKSGHTMFVCISPANKVQVIDTRKREVVSTFTVSSQRPGDGAFDESTHRLFLGTRTPPTMTVLDSASGKELAILPTVEGMDGVYFDAAHKRIYVSGGRGFDVGFVFAYQQKDADHYEFIGKVPTRPGAGTSFWAPELNRFYVAAPAHESEEAAILVFEPQP